MELLQRIAMAHYQAGSDEVQQLARDFFGIMDSNGDGKIDMHEFLMFMTQEGYSCMGNRYFFNRLDMDGNKTLDFCEVMTLYYIVKSGRPFCKLCSNFIADVYFSCVDCFESPDGGYSVCLDCYCRRIFDHRHNNGPSRFLDNYTLLEAKKNSDRNQLRYQPSTTVGQDGASMPWPQPSWLQPSWSWPPPSAISPAVVNWSWPPPPTSPGPGGVTNLNCNTLVQNFATHYPPTAPPNPSPSTANSLVPVNFNKWKVAFHALEMGLSIGSIGATVCTIL